MRFATIVVATLVFAESASALFTKSQERTLNPKALNDDPDDDPLVSEPVEDGPVPSSLDQAGEKMLLQYIETTLKEEMKKCDPLPATATDFKVTELLAPVLEHTESNDEDGLKVKCGTSLGDIQMSVPVKLKDLNDGNIQLTSFGTIARLENLDIFPECVKAIFKAQTPKPRPSEAAESKKEAEMPGIQNVGSTRKGGLDRDASALGRASTSSHDPPRPGSHRENGTLYALGHINDDPDVIAKYLVKTSSQSSTPLNMVEWSPFTGRYAECLAHFPAREQGGCGACYAFSATSAFSLQYCLEVYARGYSHSNIAIPVFTAQSMVSCKGCDGATPSEALNYIKDFGITSVACLPYYSGGSGNPLVHVEASDPEADQCITTSCQPSYEAQFPAPPRFVKGKGPRVFTGEQNIMRGLMEHGPMKISFLVNAELSRDRLVGNAENEYVVLGADYPMGTEGHAVVVYGWGTTTDNVKYWKLINSWGEWGIPGPNGEAPKGEFRMERGIDLSNIETRGAWAIDLDPADLPAPVCQLGPDSCRRAPDGSLTFPDCSLAECQSCEQCISPPSAPPPAPPSVPSPPADPPPPPPSSPPPSPPDYPPLPAFENLEDHCVTYEGPTRADPEARIEYQATDGDCRGTPGIDESGMMNDFGQGQFIVAQNGKSGAWQCAELCANQTYRRRVSFDRFDPNPRWGDPRVMRVHNTWEEGAGCTAYSFSPYEDYGLPLPPTGSRGHKYRLPWTQESFKLYYPEEFEAHAAQHNRGKPLNERQPYRPPPGSGRCWLWTTCTAQTVVHNPTEPYEKRPFVKPVVIRGVTVPGSGYKVDGYDYAEDEKIWVTPPRVACLKPPEFITWPLPKPSAPPPPPLVANPNLSSGEYAPAEICNVSPKGEFIWTAVEGHCTGRGTYGQRGQYGAGELMPNAAACASICTCGGPPFCQAFEWEPLAEADGDGNKGRCWLHESCSPYNLVPSNNGTKRRVCMKDPLYMQDVELQMYHKFYRDDRRTPREQCSNKAKPGNDMCQTDAVLHKATQKDTCAPMKMGRLECNGVRGVNETCYAGCIGDACLDSSTWGYKWRPDGLGRDNDGRAYLHAPLGNLQPGPNSIAGTKFIRECKATCGKCCPIQATADTDPICLDHGTLPYVPPSPPPPPVCTDDENTSCESAQIRCGAAAPTNFDNERAFNIQYSFFIIKYACPITCDRMDLCFQRAPSKESLIPSPSPPSPSAPPSVPASSLKDIARTRVCRRQRWKGNCNLPRVKARCMKTCASKLVYARAEQGGEEDGEEGGEVYAEEDGEEFEEEDGEEEEDEEEH
jgi:hypothetical protein